MEDPWMKSLSGATRLFLLQRLQLDIPEPHPLPFGLEREVMGWGTLPHHVEPFLPAGGRLEALEGVGHFVHIEQPRLVADLVLEFVS